jgi:hypothetical protein
MLLESAGFKADYRRLLRVLGTFIHGTPHSRIKRLSQINSDLLVIYQEGELGDLVNYLESGYPVGIFLNTKELPYWNRATGHAVVLVGYSNDIFYLHDPAFGTPQAVSSGDLELAWEAYDFYFAVVQRKQKPR